MMDKEKKFTLIDRKTQIVSWIILFIGIVIIIAYFIYMLLDYRMTFVCTLLIYIAIIIIVLALVYLAIYYYKKSQR